MISIIVFHITHLEYSDVKRYVKLRWLNRHFIDHEIIVEIDSPSSIHAFNRFEEEGHVEWGYNNFMLIDVTREELYVMEVPANLMMMKNIKS